MVSLIHLLDDQTDGFENLLRNATHSYFGCCPEGHEIYAVSESIVPELEEENISYDLLTEDQLENLVPLKMFESYQHLKQTMIGPFADPLPFGHVSVQFFVPSEYGERAQEIFSHYVVGDPEIGSGLLGNPLVEDSSELLSCKIQFKGVIPRNNIVELQKELASERITGYSRDTMIFVQDPDKR